jgi:hypothetical protein
LAFGIAYLDAPYIRGANGLSGIGDLPTEPPLLQVPLDGIFVHDDGLLLPLLPQPATARGSMSIRANRPIFSITSPLAGTVNEIDRPCPQSGDWPYLAEASDSGLTSASCYHVEEMFSLSRLLKRY